MNNINQYNKLMKKCISLAKKGMGKTSPNPLVGAIIFDDDFNIISKGYHEKYGQNHAERNAILNAKQDLTGKSIIVNLEPCSHYGKTPPCVDLIIEHKFKKVIIGMKDPNPIVAGNGIKKLKNANIEVIEHILEKECLKLNEIFIKNQIENKPFITIKTATTLDGKIATKTGSSKWITDKKARNEVQKLRNLYDAILTSSETVIKDNPSLTCRQKNSKNPIRIIADTNLKTPVDSKVYNNDGTKIYILTSEKITDKQLEKIPSHIQIIKCKIKNNHIDLKDAIQKLYKLKINSILVEAGGIFNQALIKDNLADKLIQFIAPKITGDNDSLSFINGFKITDINECINLKNVSIKFLKPDFMITGYFK